MYEQISIIPEIYELKSSIELSINDPMRASMIGRLLNQLPYSLASSAKALVTFCTSQYEIVEKYSMRDRDTGMMHMYSLEDTDWHKMAFALDSYLEAARRTQNSICLYLSQIFKQSFPQSLSDTYKGIVKNIYNIPDHAKGTITSYWTNDGEKIKSYRDLSQHHAIVSSDARISFLPDGQILIFLIIPTNPSEKSPLKLSFEPRLYAIDYMLGSYQRLLSFVCSMVGQLLNHKGRTGELIMTQEFMGGVSLKAEGRPLPDLIEIQEVFKSVIGN
ncbi:MAG: hypothetical protein ACYC57_02395 [Thermoleophilia bacterium]